MKSEDVSEPNCHRIPVVVTTRIPSETEKIYADGIDQTQGDNDTQQRIHDLVCR